LTKKSEENTLRIRTLFKDEKVDVVMNADDTFVLFHMQDGCLNWGLWCKADATVGDF
jgi:hypothetical protein